MKRLTILILAGLLAGLAPLHSQAPAKQSAIERLQTLKAQNEKLLEQQAATLQRLEEIQKEAQQLRILARRT